MPGDGLQAIGSSALQCYDLAYRVETRTFLLWRLGASCSSKLMVQSAILPGFQGEGSVPRKNGQITPEGRAHQIDSRLGHGIRSRFPILLHVESELEWQGHWEGYRAAYHPIGLVEENLVRMVAYQDWKLLYRLIPYENDKTYEGLTNPDGLRIDGVSGDVIRKILSSGEDAMRATIRVERTKLERYRVLLNRADDQNFSKIEAREILTWVAEQIQERVAAEDGDSSSGGDDDGDDEDDDDDGERITVEARDWTATEIRQQLAILGEAANVSWQKELAYLLRIWEEQLSRHSEAIDKGLAHLRLHRILGPRQHERFALYERQILGTRKALVNSLERLRCLRPVMARPGTSVRLFRHSVKFKNILHLTCSYGHRRLYRHRSKCVNFTHLSDVYNLLLKRAR